MDFKTLTRHSSVTNQKLNFKQFSIISPNFCKQPFAQISLNPFRHYQIRTKFRVSSSLTKPRKNRFITACISSGKEILRDQLEIVSQNDGNVDSFSPIHEENETGKEIMEIIEPEGKEFVANESIWNQMVEIGKFSGPATGLWICGPLMSLIDTVVIGQSSSMELAALGPGTVLCDNTSYVFMFLSIATSNFVATALAGKVCSSFHQTYCYIEMLNTPSGYRISNECRQNYFYTPLILKRTA